MTSQERDCVTRGHARPHLQETPPIQRGQAPCQGAHNGCWCSTPTHRTLRHLLLQEISDVIITKMTRSKVFLHLVPFPFFFTTAEGKERELGDGHLSWSSWPCIFKQAKSRSPHSSLRPFTHLSQCLQYSSLVKMRSSGLVLTFPLHQMQQFYCKYLQGLWKTAKTGNPKDLAWPSELRGVYRKAFGGLFWFWPRAAREMPSGFG